MTDFRRSVHNLFVWSYERGTLQYDILCALILAFVFFVPPSCFVAKGTGKPNASYQNTAVSTQNVKTSERR
jgi:hypothetical protein